MNLGMFLVNLLAVPLIGPLFAPLFALLMILFGVD